MVSVCSGAKGSVKGPLRCFASSAWWMLWQGAEQNHLPGGSA